ncbi:hypothetical protein CR513_38594, partial [Mucuna pruriens]
MKLMVKQGEPYSNPERYRRLVGKLIYLTITRPDISFAVGVVSQFMQAPCVDHWTAVLRILKYIKKTPGQGSPIDRRSTIGFFISIGGNMVSWKYCDNQAALHIASNDVFQERTKHIEIDCHFVREKLLAKEISTKFVNSSNQLVDIFTKSLRGQQIQFLPMVDVADSTKMAEVVGSMDDVFDPIKMIEVPTTVVDVFDSVKMVENANCIKTVASLIERTEGADFVVDILVNMIEIAQLVGVDTDLANGA